MHASAMSAWPAIFYWNLATVAVMHAVWKLRAAGTAAFLTIDAGPHVKVICEPADSANVEETVAACPGVPRTVVLGPGPSATLVEENGR